MSGWLNKKVAQSFSECHATSLTAAYREYCHYIFQLEFHKPSLLLRRPLEAPRNTALPPLPTS